LILGPVAGAIALRRSRTLEGENMTMVDEAASIATDLPQRAKEVAKLADERQFEAEAQGRLTDDVVEALHDSGLWGIWVPRSLGGAELDVVPSLEVVESLSYGDPSTAWVLFATGLISGATAAYCGDEAAEHLFKPGERVAVIAGQGTRPGTAVPEGDGYRLTGAWGFGSGMRHASYTHSLALVEGTNEARIFSTPVEDITIDEGSWDVMGLRATGSIDYTIDGVHVPEAYTHLATATSSPRGGMLYNLGIIGFVTLGHAAWALGLGRRMLDELIGNVEAKAGRAGDQAQNGAFLEGFVKAEGRLRSARALTYEIWGELQESLGRGEELTVPQQTLMRLSLSNATWSVHEVAQFVYTAGGTSALRSGVIQKLFRDIHAGTQHVSSGPVIRQNTGLGLAGSLADGKEWHFIELADAH
jgi:alkylation response protein AidB-like acyl-CoA dehydrogenase